MEATNYCHIPQTATAIAYSWLQSLVQVWDNLNHGTLRWAAADVGAERIGAVVENSIIQSGCFRAASDSPKITFLWPWQLQGKLRMCAALAACSCSHAARCTVCPRLSGRLCPLSTGPHEREDRNTGDRLHERRLYCSKHRFRAVVFWGPNPWHKIPSCTVSVLYGASILLTILLTEYLGRFWNLRLAVRPNRFALLIRPHTADAHLLFVILNCIAI